MDDAAIRLWRPEDRPQLKALWQLAFGDSEEYIDGFWERFLRADGCVVAEADGAVVSAMYVVPGIRLLPCRESALTAGYTYALATLPAYRGHGIGSAVYRAACEKALESADAACVLPAEESLYPFYEQASGARPLGGIREGSVSNADLTGLPARQMSRIPARQYAGMRERFLGGTPHAVFPDELYDAMEASGTEFLMTEDILAAAESDNGSCRVLELLAPGVDGMAAAAAVARSCPAREYTVRTPLFFDGPGERRPFVLAAAKAAPDLSPADDFWWGFGLD